MRRRSEATDKRVAALKTSAALADVMGQATAQKDGRRGLPYNGKLPEIGRGLGRVVDLLFAEDFDAVEEAKAIRESLTIREALTPGNVEQALNRAEEMARRAHRYYIAALADFERWKAKYEAVEGAMRDYALEQMQTEKIAKARNKTITEADIRTRCALNYPDEWADAQAMHSRYKGAVDHWKAIADLTANRCYSLNGLLAKKRNG